MVAAQMKTDRSLVINELIKMGIDIDQTYKQTNDTIETALHVACKNKTHTNNLEEILSHDPNLTLLINSDWHPLRIAVLENNSEAVEKLLNKAKESNTLQNILNSKDSSNRTPLMLANIKEHYGIAKIIKKFME